MKPCLVDVNVWLALVVERHSHHTRAFSWFETLGRNEAGWSRIIQLGVMRLLGNSSIMGPAAMPAAAAWGIIEAAGEDERVVRVEEPAGLERAFPTLLRHPVPTVKLIGDAYLAAFAINSERRLVTFDQGFRQFDGLDLLLLGN